MSPKFRERAAVAALLIAVIAAVAWWKLAEEEEKNARQRERARERAAEKPAPVPQSQRDDYVLSMKSLMTTAGLAGATAEAQGPDLAIYSSECDREMVEAVFYTAIRRELEARGFTRIICKMGEVGFAKRLRPQAQ